MFKKTLLPVCTLSSFFFVVSCGGDSSNPSENLGAQTVPIADNGSLSNDAQSTNLSELDSQLADFSRVNDSETITIEGEMNEALTNNSPLSQFTQNGIYIVSMHPLREDTNSQFISHLYCVQKSDHFSQCILFDGNTQSANLSGVKYIISKEAFELLPAEERTYWHPQNFSILSGQLTAPGRTPEQEQELANMLLNSYAKTWQTWKSIQVEREADPVPLGDAQLGWSFNADGQVREAIVDQRDQKLNVDRGEIAERRQELVDAAEPQCGVDILEADFEVQVEYIPGISARSQDECYADRGQNESEGEPGIETDKSPTLEGEQSPTSPEEQPGEEPVDQPADQGGKLNPEETPDQPGEEQPVGEQPEEPAGEQPEQPADDQQGQPVEESQVNNQAEQPSLDQPGQTVGDQTQQPSGDQPDQPADDQTEQPVPGQQDEPVEEAQANNQAEQPTVEQPDQAAGNQADQPIDQSAEQPADEPIEDEPTADEPVEEPTEEASDKIAEQPEDTTTADLEE